MLQTPTPLYRHRLSACHPPTGKMLARQLETDFAGVPFQRELARLSGRSEASVAWLLQQDIVVPASLLCAALAFQSAMDAERHDP
ncbi:hypothetical protein [Bosea sp. CS1GBMeth4]|uniref:hypothetical protein n=1 Tax=Bosea sp. CS1GBMeth4 TaxID=1892849 RepID=UPI0016486B89|nr:hypothetical protein [Bosea sp. CS1GBMeth4]